MNMRPKDLGFMGCSARARACRSHALWSGLLVCLACAGCSRPSPEEVALLEKAISKGDVAVVQDLITAHPSLTQMRLDEQKTPLHLAALVGHCEIVELLVSRGAAINATDRGGRTPLICAAGRPRDKVVQTLLRLGADTGLSAGGDTSPLHRAASNGNTKHINILLDHGVDVNLRLKGGTTALHAAASLGYIAAIELLLKRGADVNAKRQDGRTAKDSAFSAGHYAARDILQAREQATIKPSPILPKNAHPPE